MSVGRNSEPVGACDRTGILPFVGRFSMPTRSASARLLATPENRSALAAMQDVLHTVTTGAGDSFPNPVYLHGPSGAGKTLLASTLAEELLECGITVLVMSSNDFADTNDLSSARDADVLILEDLQHLPVRYIASMTALLDSRLENGNPTIITALHGPAMLTHRGMSFPRRLTDRLAGGLVVAVAPMKNSSQRRLLEQLARDANLHVAPEIITWLADQLPGGGRSLEGAIGQLATLQRSQRTPLQLADICAHFDARSISVERIAERVGGYYHIAPRLLHSARRSRTIVLARQVGMYLARQLTGFSLEKIGQCFGGRDHKTVLHACRKMESALKSNASLAGAIHALRAELS